MSDWLNEVRERVEHAPEHLNWIAHARGDLKRLLALVECYEAALLSTSKNTCCETCQEAKRVAKAALAQGERIKRGEA